jgi:hypothetical protein
MYRAQMTDTELEHHYMQGEFKPRTNAAPIHPKHMTDGELLEALKLTMNLKSDFAKELTKEATLRFSIKENN